MVENWFIEKVKAEIQKKLGEDYEIIERTVLRNNGGFLSGLNIRKAGSKLSPVIYLEEYFEEHTRGMSVTNIANDIVKIAMGDTRKHIPEIGQLTDFEQVKDKIIFRLVNYELNKAMLPKVPHIKYHDLAIVFYIKVHENVRANMMILVENGCMGNWKVSTNQLYSVALINTPRLEGESFGSMAKVFIETCNGCNGEQSEAVSEEFLDALFGPPTFYILSNKRRMKGAAVILYPGVLQKIAETLESDLVVLPCSIHEWIIATCSDSTRWDCLREMVYEINRTEVPVEDQLSDNVYRFRRREGVLELVDLVEAD